MEKVKPSKLIGKRFGSLVVESVFSELRTHKGQGFTQMVRVLCDCGVKKVMFASATYRKDILSCGCMKPLMYSKMTGENNYKFSGHREIRRTFWNKLRRGAERRGLSFSITMEYAWNLFEFQERKCVISGVPIHFGGVYPLSATTASVDRINSKLGYEVGNIQWVHKSVNMMRGSLSIDDFREWCCLVTDNWKKTC